MQYSDVIEETKGGSQRRLASVGVSRMLSRAGTLPTPTLHFTPPILIIRFSYTQNAHTYHTDHIHTNQQPTYHTFLKLLCIKTRYQSLYSQTNILILSTMLEELRQLKMQESEIMGVGRGQLLRFTQIAQIHFATALRMQSLYTYKCGQFYLKMHKIHICKHGILSVWIILINNIGWEDKIV